MPNFEIAVANPIISGDEPNYTQINIKTRIPHHETLDDARRYYYNESLKLEKALYESLCGGLYDALLYGMLQRKASLFVYSYDALEKRDAS